MSGAIERAGNEIVRRHPRAGFSTAAALDTGRSPSSEMVNRACAEIVSVYTRAGFTVPVAQEQAERFARHFVTVGDHTPERATFPIDVELDTILAGVSEAIG